MIVVFYEDNEQFVVRALDGVEQRWQKWSQICIRCSWR